MMRMFTARQHCLENLGRYQHHRGECALSAPRWCDDDDYVNSLKLLLLLPRDINNIIIDIQYNTIRTADGDHEPPADSLFNLTVKEAYSTLDTSDVDNSIIVELDNMTSLHVWDYVSPTESIGAILPCKLFLQTDRQTVDTCLFYKSRLGLLSIILRWPPRHISIASRNRFSER